MITLLVGNNDIHLSNAAKKYNAAAQLITNKNINDVIDGCFYVSLSDVSVDEFIDLMISADQIIYLPSNNWSDVVNGKSRMQDWTERCCLIFRSKVINKSSLPQQTDFSDMLALADIRKTDKKQFWSVGCSISHGAGVPNSNRYGQLIADELKLEASFLTCKGSSIVWAADQILRSDIHEDDIVVWGLTSFNRLRFYVNDKLKHITANSYKQNSDLNKIVPIDRLDDQDLIYQNVTSIWQVVNFCAKIKAKLYIAGILVSLDHIPYMSDLPNCIQLRSKYLLSHGDSFLDLGSDNMHPGPLTHKWYSEEILKIIRKSNL